MTGAPSRFNQLVVRLAKLAMLAVLVGCSGSTSSEPATERSAATVQPTAVSTVSSTEPPEPAWTVTPAQGLDVTTEDRNVLVASGDNLLLLTRPLGETLVRGYVSSDGGTSWTATAAIPDTGSSSYWTSFPSVVPTTDGWTLLWSNCPGCVTGQSATVAVDVAPDGSVGSSRELAGLTSSLDLPEGVDTYRHWGLTDAAVLADGSWIGVGRGQWARPFRTTDDTAFVARSPDGETWAVERPEPGAAPQGHPCDDALVVGPEVLVLMDHVLSDEVTLERAGYPAATPLATLGSDCPTMIGAALARSTPVVATAATIDGPGVLAWAGLDGTWSVAPLTFEGLNDVTPLGAVTSGQALRLLVWATVGDEEFPRAVSLEGTPPELAIAPVPELDDLEPAATTMSPTGELIVVGREFSSGRAVVMRSPAPAR